MLTNVWQDVPHEEVSQRAPVQPALQVQVRVLDATLHLDALVPHGLPALQERVLHVAPDQPWLHWHLKKRGKKSRVSEVLEI